MSDSLISPDAGRLCVRSVSQGSILVGLVYLPPAFVPIEGVSYLAILTDTTVAISPRALDGGLPEDYQSYGVGGLLKCPIWNKTSSADARVVRFIQAFPDHNGWVIYGPSHHSLPDTHPTHQWQDIREGGKLNPIEPPLDAAGMGVGGLLTVDPVWPHVNGQLYTLSQISSVYRPHYHRYHQLLAQSVHDTDVAECLQKTIASDPYLCEINTGRVDPGYAKFLAALSDQGLLTEDGPRSETEVASRSAIASGLARTIITDQRRDEMTKLAEELAIPTSRPRGPR